MNETRMIANWLTRKPKESAYFATAVFAVVLWSLSFAYLANSSMTGWMPATASKVFLQHEYWRLWTTLFAHGDLAHLLSNWLLFLPLAYLLNGYFGTLFFPLAGVFMGGLINIFVLKTLAPETNLIGISGVVYWMGAAWLTLYFLIDRRRSPLRRLAVAMGIALVLFFPETYKPEVSYLSHFLGFVTGVASALFYFIWNRKQIEAADVYYTLPPEPDLEGEWERAVGSSETL